MPEPTVTDAAIAANLAALAEGLFRTSKLADEAYHAMQNSERNLAIGTILPLEEELPVLQGLVTACIALHRRIGRGGAP